MVQSRLESSNQIGTGGSLSTYRRSGFWVTESPQLIALGSTDLRNAERTFGTEPMVSARVISSEPANECGSPVNIEFPLVRSS